ncbi:hypothetical protein Q3C01_15675 [Bradyrhizobium sp. UFLA05-109]
MPNDNIFSGLKVVDLASFIAETNLPWLKRPPTIVKAFASDGAPALCEGHP